MVGEILEEGDVCTDVGANFGLYSIYGASIVGEKGEVIAIEPYKENYKELENNIKLNKIINIRVIKKAVSDEEAIRAIKKSPLWKAGIQNGRPVRVSYVMPIVFRLD